MRGHLRLLSLLALSLSLVIPLSWTPEQLGPAARADDATARTSPAPQFDSQRPNILLITTDDQTLQEMKYLPATRQLLGDAGVTFTHMLSPHPLCCPARAELMTGQYAQNNGVYTNGGLRGGWGALLDPANTLGAWLQDAGYRTAMLGKFLNKWRPDQHGIPEGWSDFRASPVDSFGYYDFRINANGRAMSFADGESYSTTYITDATVELIQQWSEPELDGLQAGQHRPFFIWSSYYAPHGDCRNSSGGCKAPPTPERQYADEYSSEEAPAVSKPSFNEPGDAPNPVVRKKVRKGRPDTSAAAMNHLHRQRARSLISVDHGVQSIVSTLAQAGQLDNTLILFTSDNGYLLGEHQYLGKVLAYDEALRVPLLVRGPGIPEGEQRSQFVTTVDLAPTIVAAAGAVPGRRVDGRDLSEILTRDVGGKVDTILVQAGQPKSVSEQGTWLYRGVRTKRWTYTRWVTTKGDVFHELFDNKRDPFQVRNLASSSRARDRRVLRDLRQRASTLGTCSGTVACFRSFSGPAG